VEDDASQRRWLERILARRAGPHADVVAVADLLEARAVVGPVHVLVADYGLPDGKTAFDVHAAWPDVPMVVISGRPPPPDYGGPWLMKPFASEALMGVIAEVLKGAAP
jgi:DNA-binding NtrC family response regulator